MELINITNKLTEELNSLNNFTLSGDVLKIVKEINSLAQDLLDESKNVK